jgi:IMP dehydrogenase
MKIPRFKELERAYGFDEVALVPGDVTINPDQTNINFAVGKYNFSLPVIASAMDAVVDPDMAIRLNKLGGLAVLNMDGIQARYDNPREVLDEY